MTQFTPEYSGAGLVADPLAVRESTQSAIAWPAILGGAAVAVAVTFLLLALSTGIGLASVSPWTGNSPSPTAFTVTSAIGLIVVQWLSSGVGGYLTGRLRTKWAATHSHEVFFRDTANGFVTWAVASVVVIGVLASAGSSVLGNASRAAAIGSSVAYGVGQTAQGVSSSGQSTYLLDTLFRPAQPNAGASAPAITGEAARILATSLSNGSMAPADRSYLASMVAARAGISQADAEKRIDDAMVTAQAAEAKVKQAADDTRKAAASLSFYTFFSMLIGAFIACAAAALGGRGRDEIALRPIV